MEVEFVQYPLYLGSSDETLLKEVVSNLHPCLDCKLEYNIISTSVYCIYPKTNHGAHALHI